MRQEKQSKKRSPFFLITILLLLAVLLGVVLSFGQMLPADKTATAAAVSDAYVEVSDQPSIIALVPKDTTLTRGFIFYPGARVDPVAYIPLLKPLAQEGTLVVIPKMPFGFAVFDINKAAQVQAAYPQITCWVIGGHSLGGSMAAEYAADYPAALKGIVFIASYPAKNTSLRGYDLKGLVISGSQDGLATQEKINAVLNNFPQDSQFIVLDGANHAQFGHYGVQVGDLQATMSQAAQQEATSRAIIDFISSLNGTCNSQAPADGSADG